MNKINKYILFYCRHLDMCADTWYKTNSLFGKVINFNFQIRDKINEYIY